MMFFSRCSILPSPPPGLQQAEVKGAHAYRFQRVRDVAFGDSDRQTFHQRGLADARLADQYRVVLAATGECITIWRISLSRPNTGSILPSRARAVTSRVNLSSAFCSGFRSLLLRPH
jgi:hypothetical protein